MSAVQAYAFVILPISIAVGGWALVLLLERSARHDKHRRHAG